MQNPVEVKQRACPDCQAVVPVHMGYVPWCDECGWNVIPQSPDPPRNIYESVYSSLGQKQGQAILDDFIRAEALKPTLTISRFLAFVYAGMVHGVTVIFAILGITLPILGWPNPFLIIGGLVCIGIVWLLRPRFPKMPNTILSRKEFPRLYKLLDAIALSLDAPEADGVVFDGHFSARFGRVGWQRKRVLRIGLPLWTILDDQEKVALVAHELAHSVNGDASRGFLIGSAIRSLAGWYALLRPYYILPPGSGIQGLLMIPINLVMLGLSGLVWLIAYVLSHLLWQDSQRAEYQADYLAATVSGTDAMLSLFEKLHFGRVFDLTLHRTKLGQGTNQDFFEELRQRATAAPQRELERLRRVQRLEASRLDSTHPPTAYRIKLLQAHRVSRPKAMFSPSDFEQLERELSTAKEEVQQKLIGGSSEALIAKMRAERVKAAR